MKIFMQKSDHTTPIYSIILNKKIKKIVTFALTLERRTKHHAYFPKIFSLLNFFHWRSLRFGTIENSDNSLFATMFSRLLFQRLRFFSFKFWRPAHPHPFLGQTSHPVLNFQSDSLHLFYCFSYIFFF